MFKKIIFSAFFTLGFLVCYSQESSISIPLEMKGNRDVFQIVNKLNNTVTLFLSDKKKVTAIRLDESFKIIDSLTTERPDKKYSEILGYSGDYNKPTLYWGKSNKKEILEQEFDFLNKKTNKKDYSFELKKEKVITTLTSNKTFYIITCSKETSTLNFYTFKDNNIEHKKIELGEETFYNSEEKRTRIYDVLTEQLLTTDLTNSFEIISNESLVSLKSSSIKRKIYLNDDKITFTFDNFKEITQCLFIDFKNLEYHLKYYKNPKIEGDQWYINSNSFLLDNKVFQIKTSEGEFYLTVKDIEGNLLKTHYLKKSDSLYFNNSPIIQENGEFSGYRELEKTSKFIRKVNNLNCGLTVHHLNGNYLITIGGISRETPNANATIWGGMFGFTGAILAAALNPTMDSFNSYSNQKVVYTNCLFNKDIESIEGTVPQLPFDKIRSYIDENKDLKSKTLFKFKGYYYLGYYDKEKKEYFFEKFEETIK